MRARGSVWASTLGVGLLVSLSAGADEASCRTDDHCTEGGECSYVEGEGCLAVSREDCRRAEVCRVHGLCTPEDGVRVATSARDCRSSEGCLHDEKCFLDRAHEECDDGVERHSLPMLLTGVGLAGVGAVNALFGAVLYRLQERRDAPSHPIVIGMMIGGGLGIAVGFPLMAVGGTTVERPVTMTVLVETGEVALRIQF